MQRIKMSANGPTFSRLIQGYWRMGSWQRNAQEHLAFIEKHLELGITTVDHAHVYAPPPCEQLFGDALKLKPALRDQMEIVSKCGITPADIPYYDSSRDAILKSVDTSLSRLGIDHLDVLLVHRPDFLMDADEVAATFAELKQQGKVLHFGVSNFSPSQFELLNSRWQEGLVTNQVEINPINMATIEDGTLDQAQQLGVKPMAWSCLAGGQILTGNSEADVRLRATLKEVQQELGLTDIAQVLFAWTLRLPSQPLPIIGSGNIARVESAIEALHCQLSTEQWYRIWTAAKGHFIP